MIILSRVGGWIRAALAELTHNRPPGFHWKEDFPRHLGVGFAWILALSILLSFMESSGMLIGFERASLDSFLNVKNRKASDIRIVEIGEDDYTDTKLFAGRSPLKSRLVSQLVKEVASYGPAVIGVDLDTSDVQWGDTPLEELLSKENCGLLSKKSCIVWAEVPEGAGTKTPLPLTSVAAGKVINPAQVGIPLFPIDQDGLVRHYYDRQFETSGWLDPARPKDSANPPIETFSRAVAQNYIHVKGKQAGKPSPLDAHGESIIFNFYGDRYRFPTIPAHDFLLPARPSMTDVRPGRETVLRDSIVLIGGTFKEARDSYLTPLGWMFGVELNALAIESVLHNGGIHEIQDVLRFLVDIFFSICVIVVFFAWPRHPRRVFWSCAIGVFLASLGFSFALYNRTTAYWLSFMPIVIGMMLHEAIELADAAQESQEGLAEGEEEISRLESELRHEQRKHAPQIALHWRFITNVRETILPRFVRRAAVEGPRHHYDDGEFEKLLAEASAAQKAQGLAGTQLAS